MMKGLFTRILPSRSHFSVSVLLLYLLSALFAAPVTAGQSVTTNPPTTAEQAASSDASSESPAPSAIPSADIATRATEVSGLLHTFAGKLTRSDKIDAITESFPLALDESARDREETLDLLQRAPALPTLQAEERKWQQIQVTFSNWLVTLTKRSKELQDALNQLAALQATWSLTLDSAKAANIPDAGLQQINDILADIRDAKASMKAELSMVLDFQSQVGDAVAKSGTILARITQLQKASMSGIFVQDSLPIWNMEVWAGVINKLPGNVRSAVETYQTAIVNYFQSPLKRLFLHAGLFVLLILLFFVAHIKVREMTAAGLTFSPTTRIFNHPFSAALTISLLVATDPIWSQMPATVRDTYQLLAFVPMIILIRSLVSAIMIPCLYALGLLFALDTLREILASQQALGQVLLTLEAFIGVAVTLWFLRKIRLAAKPLSKLSHPRALQSVTVLVLLGLTAGLASAAMGYVRLSLLITPGIIAAGVLALTLFASLQIALGLIAVAFKVWPLRNLGMVQHHRVLLERRLSYVLIMVALGSLILRCLSYLGLLAPLLEFGKTILEIRIERGVISVTLGDILEFILTVWAAYLLSAFLRFILREDVYPRVKMPQGNSYAVSSLLHYIIVALGFLAAVAAIGVDLTKLTVLTGAFGIGLGFGLQGVVNNFVSGLILLFERPIHVGDTIEIGNLLGSVQRIGIRASTVLTVQGADIIVPNSQMVAEKVTNWTLSNRLRRIELPVGVSYGTQPEAVINVLEEVALANPGIAHYPPPQGLMVGYGDSSLDFELRVWTDQFDNWVQIRSELAVAVYHAVAAAGMTFPFPQREVRLLKDDVERGKIEQDES